MHGLQVTPQKEIIAGFPATTSRIRTCSPDMFSTWTSGRFWAESITAPKRSTAAAIINFLMIFYLSNGAGQKHFRPARTTTYNLNILSHPITGARIVIRGSSHGDCGIYCFANLGIDQVFAALTRFVATGAAPFTEAAVTSVPASEAPESSTFVIT